MWQLCIWVIQPLVFSQVNVYKFVTLGCWSVTNWSTQKILYKLVYISGIIETKDASEVYLITVAHKN